MKGMYIAAAIFFLASAPLTYWMVTFLQKYQISQLLISEASAYQEISKDYTTTLLVLGDSTGVGVGAAHVEDSVAGRLAIAMNATYVENRAVSGAFASDIEGQLKKASLEKYDVILIQVGGNDIVRFHDPQITAGVLEKSVHEAVSRSNRTFLLSAGNVGATTNFPAPMRPYYTKLTLRYHEAFNVMAEREGTIYVNLYVPPEDDPFTADPDKYLAIDGFHPSDDGYGLWFEKLWNIAKPQHGTN